MAIKTEWRDPNGLTGISCLSSDTKPDAPAGSICWETDTGNRFERDGTTWQPTGTGGAAHVATQAGSVWSYGNWPATWYNGIAGSAGTNDNDVIIQTTDSSEYSEHIIHVGYGGETGNVELLVSLDGTNGLLGVNDRHIFVEDMDAAAGVGTRVDGAALTPGIYRFFGKYKVIQVVQSGATAANAYMVEYNGRGGV